MRAIRTRQIFNIQPVPVSPAVYGNTTVGMFLQDAANNVDSVDILIAGDSNTNFGGWGWADGFNFALQNNTSAKEYASPILPTTSWDSPFYYGVNVTEGAFSKINASGTVVNPGGSPALGGTLVSGITSGPAALTAGMTRGSGSLQPNTSPFDYGWVASGDFADPFAAIFAYESSARLQWITDEIRYRVVHGKGPGMGTLRLASRLDVAPFTANGTTSISCAQASYEWVTSTLTIAAASGRAGQGHGFNVCSNAISSSFMTGPMAWALHSISRPVKGYAVTCISHHGGANMDTVASNVAQAATIISQYLKEARARQIACGGRGRVIVCIQGGINAGVNPWGTSAQSFFQTCTTEWIALGFPSEDLAFLGFVSHQRDAVDGLATERASAIALAAAVPSYTIVNLPTLVTYDETFYGNGSMTSWFANSSSDRNHLSALGYQAISSKIMNALLASV